MPSAEPLHPGRLFIVDDDVHVLSSLRFSLEADGYEVVTLSSGEALIEYPPLGTRDCIIIDQRLPGRSNERLGAVGNFDADVSAVASAVEHEGSPDDGRFSLDGAPRGHGG